MQRVHGTDWFADAVKQGVITAAEGEQLRELEALTARVIAVDHFDPAEVRPHFMTPGHNARRTRRTSAGGGRSADVARGQRGKCHGVDMIAAEGLAVLDRSRRASPGRSSTARARARTRSAARALEELGAIVERVEQGARDKTIRGLVIMSGKEKGFIVGADVREFEQIQTEQQVTESVTLVNA